MGMRLREMDEIWAGIDGPVLGAGRTDK